MSGKKENGLSSGFHLKDLLDRKNIPMDGAGPYRERIEALEKENRNLKESLGKITRDVNGLREEAIRKLKENSCPEALGLLLAALVLDEGHIKTMINLSVAYARMGEKKKALKMLETVLAKDPENATAKRNLDILAGE